MKKMTSKMALIPSLLLASNVTFAAESSHLEMPHAKGAFMIEYKYMRMNMEDLQLGTDNISTATAVSPTGYDHLMVPTKMTMDMHMIMPMYNITKDVSVMLMAGYLSNNMDMEMRNGNTMNMKTSGLTDTSVSANYKFFKDMLAASFELSIPTGSIDEKANNMMGMPVTAPYAMQLGSGTYDVTPTLTYLGAYFDLRYGAQASYKLRTGENDNGYTLGNAAEFLTWVRKPVMGVTLDAELKVKKWGAIDGKDDSISIVGRPMMDGKAPTTSFTGNYGGTMATVSVGASMPVSIVSVGVNMDFPVYQDLNGAQLQRKMGMGLSLSAMF